MKRRQARELMIQALYQIDMVKCTWQEALQHLLEDSDEEEDAAEHADQQGRPPLQPAEAVQSEAVPQQLGRP